MAINKEDLRNLFAEELDVELHHIVDSLEYNTISEWDSIAHMRLIAAIEEKFDIMIDTDDVIDMSSFKVAFQIVNKYVDGD